ncbi:hypothetical protein J6590_054406 [Homalodisca vitripennis]|nr:hypothetical protein J6590_054406 [Homalodisca vitripennis]
MLVLIGLLTNLLVSWEETTPTLSKGAALRHLRTNEGVRDTLADSCGRRRRRAAATPHRPRPHVSRVVSHPQHTLSLDRDKICNSSRHRGGAIKHSSLLYHLRGEGALIYILRVKMSCLLVTFVLLAGQTATVT